MEDRNVFEGCYHSQTFGFSCLHHSPSIWYWRHIFIHKAEKQIIKKTKWSSVPIKRFILKKKNENPPPCPTSLVVSLTESQLFIFHQTNKFSTLIERKLWWTFCFFALVQKRSSRKCFPSAIQQQESEISNCLKTDVSKVYL